MSWNSAAMYSTQGLSKPRRQLRAERVFVRMLGMKKRRTLRSTIRMCWSTV
jgi:hypothetical protein